MLRNSHRWLFIITILLSVGCNRTSRDSNPPIEKDDKRKLGFGSIADEDFLAFGPGKKNLNSSVSFSINPYLWQASLQTLQFLPLASIDSVGGVVVTDWHSTATFPNEKIKVCVYISNRVLKADAIKVIVYKQARLANGNWVHSNSPPQTAVDLENIILTKARQLRMQDKKE